MRRETVFVWIVAMLSAELVLAEQRSTKNSIGMEFIEIETKEPESPENTVELADPKKQEPRRISFLIGSPENEEGRDADENQVRKILISDYSLGKTEVTQGQWFQVMETEPWKAKPFTQEGANYPASFISWDEAVAFCEKLTTLERNLKLLPENEHYRLPTEVEWEFACRGPLQSPPRRSGAYSCKGGEEELSEYAWTMNNTTALQHAHAHEVGLKKSNEWGFHDMHGNVWEWCLDGYSEKHTDDNVPVDTNKIWARVFRGGSWDTLPKGCRSASRNFFYPSLKTNSIGFRVARTNLK